VRPADRADEVAQHGGPAVALLVGHRIPIRRLGPLRGHLPVTQVRPREHGRARTCGQYSPFHLASAGSYGGRVTVFRIGEAAELLGVSADTVRRWIDAGRLVATRDEHGHRTIDGVDLAEFAHAQAGAPDDRSDTSARNRLRGIVTAVVKDTVMAQVDIQAGPFRIVSLMSREAVDDLHLEVGSVAVAVVKSTNVVVERAAPVAAHRGRTSA
jgi:molybdopterin-binding protein